jgi:hypothetical protein
MEALLVIYITGIMLSCFFGFLAGPDHFDFIFLSPFWPVFYLKFAYKRIAGKM